MNAGELSPVDTIESFFRVVKGKFKRMLSFFFVEKEKLSARKIDFNDFDQVFFTAERLSCFEMQPRQRSL